MSPGSERSLFVCTKTKNLLLKFMKTCQEESSEMKTLWILYLICLSVHSLCFGSFYFAITFPLEYLQVGRRVFESSRNVNKMKFYTAGRYEFRVIMKQDF